MVMGNMQQLVDLLDELRKLPSETEWVEFKEAKTSFSFKKLGQYFSALSNEANLKRKPQGWLIFGIHDKTREVTSTAYRNNIKDLDSLKGEIAQHTTGNMTFAEIHELQFREGRVLLFEIPPAPRGVPIAWQGHYYGRNGEELCALNLHEIEQIRNQGISHDWTAQICPNASIDDLDDNALSVAREKFKSKNRSRSVSEEIDGWDTVTFLDRARLTVDGKITRAALILLGKPESAYHLLPGIAHIVWKLDAEEKAYEHFGPPFLTTVNEVFARIRNIKFKIQPFNRLIPIELYKYDPWIVLEALNNCIAHQDYESNARIILTEKGDRLVLQSVGGFFEGTIEDYVLRDKTPERYRNPFLATAMVNLDMIDTMGYGIKKMFIKQRNRYFPMPDYDLNDPGHVTVQIMGRLIDENYSRILIEKGDLDLRHVVALDKVQKKQSLSKEELTMLRRAKLIEGRAPHVYVASFIAEMVDEKAQYIKIRGLNDFHYEKIVLELIEKFGPVKRKDVDDLLLDKLPDILTPEQKRQKVGNLLTKLRKSGAIVNSGSRAAPLWEIVKKE
jgi:ATP-dependent DNA helicase RecG